MLKKVEECLKQLTRGKRADLKDDICILQTCQDERMFVKASELFLQKWKPAKQSHLTEYLDYFQTQWLLKNQKQNLSFCHRRVEATNTYIDAQKEISTN